MLLLGAPPPFFPPGVFVKFTHSLPSGVPGEGVRSVLGGACIPFSLQGPSSPQVGWGWEAYAGQVEWGLGREETQIPRWPVSPAPGYICCTLLRTGNDLSPGEAMFLVPELANSYPSSRPPYTGENITNRPRT